MAKANSLWVSPELVSCRYPQVISPNGPESKFDAGKFTLQVMIPKNNEALVESVKAQIAAAAADGKLKGNWHSPLRDGDEKTDEETGDVKKGYEGMYFFTAKTGAAYPPKVFNARNEAITDSDAVDGLVWFDGKVAVNFKPYDAGIGKGVTAYLSQVQVIKPGDRRSTACAFDSAEEEVEYEF